MLDKRVLSDGKCTLYLRVTKNRKIKKISLGIKCLPDNYINGELTRKHKGYRADNEILALIKSKALKIIRTSELENKNLSLEDFDKIFRGKEQNRNVSVYSFSLEIENELKRLGKMSSAKAYTDTRKSLKKFKPKLTFEELTSEVLSGYEVFLRDTGSETGGVAFRMRQLRALYNKAINRDKVKREFYPFREYKVSKLKPSVQKIALSIEEIKAFKNVDLREHPELQEAKDYFMFSFYGRGINFQDMMLLQESNLRDGRVYYQRSKTKKRLNFALLEPAKNILNYYSDKNDSSYVFPILLNKNMSPQQVKNRKQKVISRVNYKLKRIAKLAGIEKNITFYVARHSFATIQKKKGSSIEKISEMLGHKNVSITMVYLKDFSNEELDAENEKLLDL